jgi:hypothetical protein
MTNGDTAAAIGLFASVRQESMNTAYQPTRAFPLLPDELLFCILAEINFFPLTWSGKLS